MTERGRTYVIRSSVLIEYPGTGREVAGLAHHCRPPSPHFYCVFRHVCYDNRLVSVFRPDFIVTDRSQLRDQPTIVSLGPFHRLFHRLSHRLFHKLFYRLVHRLFYKLVHRLGHRLVHRLAHKLVLRWRGITSRSVVFSRSEPLGAE